jgi:hypothetical protein
MMLARRPQRVEVTRGQAKGDRHEVSMCSRRLSNDDDVRNRLGGFSCSVGWNLQAHSQLGGCHVQRSPHGVHQFIRVGLP